MRLNIFDACRLVACQAIRRRDTISTYALAVSVDAIGVAVTAQKPAKLTAYRRPSDRLIVVLVAHFEMYLLHLAGTDRSGSSARSLQKLEDRGGMVDRWQPAQMRNVTGGGYAARTGVNQFEPVRTGGSRAGQWVADRCGSVRVIARTPSEPQPCKQPSQIAPRWSVENKYHGVRCASVRRPGRMPALHAERYGP